MTEHEKRGEPATPKLCPQPAPVDPQKRKMRTKEAAHYVGLSPSTLEKMRVYGGGCRYTKLGRVVVYDVADLDSWVAQNSRTTTSDAGTGDAPFAVPEFPLLVVERFTQKETGRPLFFCTLVHEDGGRCIVHDTHSFMDALAAARGWREDGVPTLWVDVEH